MSGVRIALSFVVCSAIIACHQEPKTSTSRTASSGANETATPVSRVRPDCSHRAKNSDGSPQHAASVQPSEPRQTLVLNYSDFGPQVSASKLLGFEWWSWEGGGNWEPCDAFDIRVVVYRDVSEATVKKRYPSARSKADVEAGRPEYRFVAYAAAIAHLENELQLIKDEPTLASMRHDLLATRTRIIGWFGR